MSSATRHLVQVITRLIVWADPEGGQGVQTPLKNHKNIEFLCNTGPAPEKSKSYQASIQCWAIIGPAVKRFAGGPMIAHL